MTDANKKRRARGTTITITSDTRDLLASLGGDADPDGTIRRLAKAPTKTARREVYALDFRLAMTPDQELPNLTLLAEAVRPVTNAEGKVMGLLVTGPYGGETKKAVTELVSWLAALKRTDHVRLFVLGGGHTPVARVKDATVFEPSLRIGGIGYSLILLADTGDILDAPGLGPTLTEAEWRRLWIG